MNIDRFGTLLRAVAPAPSRRAVMRARADATVGGITGASTSSTRAGEQPERKRKQRDLCRGHDDETPCAIGKRCCAERCVDVLAAADHCGQCENACDRGLACVGGSCCAAGSRCICTAPGGACGPPPNDWPGPAPCCNVGVCTGGACPCA